MYRSWNTCCDPWFFRRMWKLSFLTILYAQENLKGCVPWALQRKSTDGFGCYAKYLIFTDTSWTEILHVVARIPFYSFAQASGFPPLNGKKNEWVCFICSEGRPRLIKIKAGFYIKNYFDNYHEVTATSKKKKSEE